MREDIERNAYKSIVKMLIIRHQRIISFSKNIEALFSNIALIQFLSNTLIICCLGFLIVIVSSLKYRTFLSGHVISLYFQSVDLPNGSTMLVKSVFFYIGMSTQAFVFCFVGEYLSSKVSVFILNTHSQDANSCVRSAFGLKIVSTSSQGAVRTSYVAIVLRWT